MSTSISPYASTKRMLHQLASAFMHSSQLLRENQAQQELYLQPLCPQGLESRRRDHPKRSKKYQKYSDDLKRSIMLSIDAGIEKGASSFQTIRQIADMHGIPRKNIQRWYANAKEAKVTLKRGKQAMFPLIEQKLIEFVNASSCRVTRKLIIAKGRQLVLQCYGEKAFGSFRGSNQWFYNFLRRHAELRSLLVRDHKESMALGVND